MELAKFWLHVRQESRIKKRKLAIFWQTVCTLLSKYGEFRNLFSSKYGNFCMIFFTKIHSLYGFSQGPSFSFFSFLASMRKLAKKRKKNSASDSVVGIQVNEKKTKEKKKKKREGAC